MTSNKKSNSIFSTSCAASVFMALYLVFAMLKLYRLMYPLAFLDLSTIPPSNFVGPLWKEKCGMNLKIYLSSRPTFTLDFLAAEFSDDESPKDVLLLWQQKVDTASISKSFVLTTLECNDEQACQEDVSYEYARKWLDHAEHTSQQDSGILSQLSASAGEGIESTSVLLSLYNAAYANTRKLVNMMLGRKDKDDSPPNKERILNRSVISLSKTSPLWSTLTSNSTLHVHVVVTRHDGHPTNHETLQDASMALRRAAKSHSLLLGHVNLIKYDLPHHVNPPKRLLYRDVVYMIQRYLLQNKSVHPPWDTAYSNPTDHVIYQDSLKMKQTGAGYPYWKPEVAVKYVQDDVLYPMDHVHTSGMEIIKISSPNHPTGYAQLPALHVDEIGLTSEKYIPVNSSLTTLPLRISVDRSDLPHALGSTATAGGISPARWRLLSHLSSTIEAQSELGFEQSDIDELRHLIADTNVTLLAITILASALHLLFEFLTFKNEVSFWRSNRDLTGLSVRSLFLDMMGQVVILLFLIEKDSSLLMTVPAGIGCLIALWKCQRGAGFQLVPKNKDPNTKVSWWNVVPRLFGYEVRATRLDIRSSPATKKETKAKSTSAPQRQDLAALTIEMDRTATRSLGAVLLPLVLSYTLYSFFREQHTGWYSWLITCASSAVYALGFVLMTPQLFLNYKLKSVAHLPWRVLVYKFLNTFIDDLFAFIIRMPAMARLSCFRDDVVFIIYLYQRWLYPVDTSRPVEGGGGAAGATATITDAEKKNQ